MMGWACVCSMNTNYEVQAEKTSSTFHGDEKGTREEAQWCKYILSLFVLRLLTSYWQSKSWGRTQQQSRGEVYPSHRGGRKERNTFE